MKLKRKVQPSEAVLAALASGASEEEVAAAGEISTEEAPPAPEVVPAEPAVVEEQPAPVVAAEDNAEVVTQLQTTITTLEADVARLQATCSYLSAELPKAQNLAASLQARFDIASQELDANRTTAAATTAALRQACETISVALNVPKETAASLSGVELANHYQSLRTQFNSRFKVGATAKAVAEVPGSNEQDDSAPDPVRQAAVRATSLNRNK